MHAEWSEDLGSASRRDPDALPPQNLFQLVMFWVYSAATALGRGNCLYALKAGLLTGITSERVFILVPILDPLFSDF